MCKSHNINRMDKCLRNIILLMNLYGIVTLGSCCGHGKYNISIIVKDKGRVYDVVSGKTIPRKKRFYRRDPEGYYYLPECVELDKGKLVNIYSRHK